MFNKSIKGHFIKEPLSIACFESINKEDMCCPPLQILVINKIQMKNFKRFIEIVAGRRV